MDPNEREKLKVLKASLERRIERRDHRVRHVGKRILKGGLALGGFMLGAIVAAKSRSQRGIGAQSAQALGAAVATMLPARLLSDLLKADPQALIPDDDMDVVLLYLRERLATGVPAGNQATMRGDTLVLWFRGRSSYSGKNLVAGRYLHALLSRPGHSIQPTELVQRFGRTVAAEDRERRDRLSTQGNQAAADYADSLARERKEAGRVKDGDAVHSVSDRDIEVATRATIRRIEARLSKLPKKAAAERGALEDEKRKTETFLKTITRPGGGSAEFVREEKKAATAVRNLVTKGLLPHLALQDAELADHLRTSLTFGQSGCVYEPNPPETWHCT